MLGLKCRYENIDKYVVNSDATMLGLKCRYDNINKYVVNSDAAR